MPPAYISFIIIIVDFITTIYIVSTYVFVTVTVMITFILSLVA